MSSVSLSLLSPVWQASLGLRFLLSHSGMPLGQSLLIKGTRRTFERQKRSQCLSWPLWTDAWTYGRHMICRSLQLSLENHLLWCCRQLGLLSAAFHFPRLPPFLISWTNHSLRITSPTLPITVQASKSFLLGIQKCFSSPESPDQWMMLQCPLAFHEGAPRVATVTPGRLISIVGQAASG